MSKKVIIGIALSFLLLSAIGFTYAFFTATVNGNEDAKDQVVETGTLSLVYKDGQEISLNNAYPGDSINKTFTVTNTGTLIADYSINLSELINTIENDELVIEGACLSYEKYDSDKSIKDVCMDIDNQIVPMSDTATNATIKNNISIKPGITHEYTLKMTFIETNDSQNYNQGKSFSSKVQINESTESNQLVNRILRDNVIYADNVNSEFVQNTNPGINFSAISSDTNGKGLYSLSNKTLSEGGKDVYYFRGAVENNYIVFAEHCWKIVRTNEDGSIKLRYQAPAIENDGVYSCPTTTTAIATSQPFNAKYDDNAYVGWMHGTVGSSDYASAHTNMANSDIKTVVDNWYASNIANNEGYHSKVANTIYCSDRSITSPTDMPTITLPSGTVYTNTGLGYAKNVTFYRGVKSFVNPVSNDTTNNYLVASDVQSPTYVCANQNDEFTLSVEAGGTNGYGNNDLIYPVGLITMDEAVFAGGNYYRINNGSSNSSYFLKPTTNWYWTMTPSSFLGSRAYVFYVNATGYFGSSYVGYSSGSALPAISLKPDVTVSSSSNGTANNPYVVE